MQINLKLWISQYSRKNKLWKLTYDEKERLICPITVKSYKYEETQIDFLRTAEFYW